MIQNIAHRCCSRILELSYKHESLQKLKTAIRSTPIGSALRLLINDIPHYERWRSYHHNMRRDNNKSKVPENYFSVITTAYDTPIEYLEELFSSFITQPDIDKIEWVLLDNGSKDPDVIKYLKNLRCNNFIKYYREEYNLGIIGGMRYCLEKATNKYIIPVDSDDVLYTNCFRNIYRFSRKSFIVRTKRFSE